MSAIDPLPPAPSISNPATFDADTDAFLAALPGLVTQINALEASLRASAQPLGMPYSFSTTTTDSDPGPGFVRASTATFVVGAGVVLRTDLVDNLGVTRTPQLNDIAASTNPAKAVVRLQAPGDASKFVDIAITAMASPTGYKNFTGVVLATSSATPFANNDSLVLLYVRAGDKGDTGAFATWTSIGTTTVSGSPTSVTIASIPTTYSDLAFVFDIPNWGGANTTLQLATSADGSTFSGFQPFPISTVGARGLVLLFGYRLDYQFAICGVNGGGQNNLSGWQAATSTELGFRTDGGVVAVRFAAQGNPFANGTIKALGR